MKTEEKIGTFERATLAKFIFEQHCMEPRLIERLEAIDRSIKFDRLLSASKAINEEMVALGCDINNISEYVKLMEKDQKIQKKLDKLIHSNYGRTER